MKAEEKHNKCIEALYQTGIDPNDTEERSKFLSECVNKE